MAEIGVLIADDLEHVRQGLRTILKLVGDLKVVGEACNGFEAVQLAGQLEPDVVLMDLEMPKMDGLEAIRRVKGRHLGIAVVVITVHDTADVRERATRMGTDAFVAKGTDTEILFETIQSTIKLTRQTKTDEGSKP